MDNCVEGDMAFLIKLPSGFRYHKTRMRRHCEGVYVGNRYPGDFLDDGVLNTHLPKSYMAASIGLAVLLVFFSSAKAFTAETADAPIAVTPAEQAYNAYQKGDFETARTLWKQAATQGDASAQYNLGLIYAEGRGVVRNPQAAIKWWRLAAENGHHQAQHNLALAYISGETMLPGIAEEPRFEAAVLWLRKAAKSGLASSRYILGSVLLEHARNPEDEKEAIGFLSAAADQDNPEAQLYLAIAFFTEKVLKPIAVRRWLFF